MGNAEWYQKNRAKKIAQATAWRKANPEKKRAHNLTWKKANPEKLQEYYQNTRDIRIAQSTEWTKTHPDNRRTIQRVHKLKSKYGLTLEAWDAMLIAQCGRCAICGNPMTGKNEPNADHNHKTKKARELLCGPCNRGLGDARERVDTLRKMIEYLLKHQSDQTPQSPT